MNRRTHGFLPILTLCLGIALPALAADDPEAKLPYCNIEVGAKQAMLQRLEDSSSAEATLLKQNITGDWKKDGTLKKGASKSLAANGHYRVCFDVGSAKRDMQFSLNKAASFTLTGYNLLGKSKTLSVSDVTKGQETFVVKDATITLND
jgi:hypothetical protein